MVQANDWMVSFLKSLISVDSLLSLFDFIKNIFNSMKNIYYQLSKRIYHILMPGIMVLDCLHLLLIDL